VVDISRALLAVVLLASAEVRALPDGWGKRPVSLSECAGRVRRDPSMVSWLCYWRLGFEQRNQRLPVIAEMERIRSRTPDDPNPTFVEATILDIIQGGERTRALYREAQTLYQRQGNLGGEFTVTIALLGHAAWIVDAELGTESHRRALDLARVLGDPDAFAYADQTAADLAISLADYGRAETLIRQAQQSVTPQAPIWVRWRLSLSAGRILALTGRARLALDQFDRAAAMVRDEPTLLALTNYGRAAAAVRLASAGELPEREAEQRLEEAISVSRAAGMKTWWDGGELPARLLLAALRGPTPESVRDVQEALDVVRTTHQGFVLNAGLRLLTRFAAEVDPTHPERARTFAAQTLAEAKDNDYFAYVPLAWLAHAHVDWVARDRAALEEHAALVLEALDGVRWRQPEPLVRARTSAEWAFAYEMLAGWMLDVAGPVPDLRAVAQSFGTMERLRARTLLDELVRSGVALRPVPADLAARRASVLGDLTRAQRDLVSRETADAARAPLREDVARAEGALADVEDAIARNDPTSAPAPVAELREIQASLAEDEALLSFQLWRPEVSLFAPWPHGASWVTLVTRTDAMAMRVPDGHVLEPELATFRSLLLRGDGSEREGAARLGRELLGPALDSLPPRIRSLVVVPDGPLHGIPLETLRLADGQPLGARFTVATVPSASLWMRWHGMEHRPEGPALAFADPSPDAPPGRDRDASRWLEALNLPSLPHARAEASSVVEALGGSGTLLVGQAASEHFLKTTDLRRWQVLHFATHAVVDETEPNRSALVLAAGDPSEDGLLQPREIATLDLHGKLVLLSACRAASGELLQGEGALGLVRAFFRAGAQAVVASPWPLMDVEAEALITELSHRLSEGQPLGMALAGAKEARRAAGTPAVAWAGLQLYGDGSLVTSRPGLVFRLRRPLLAGALVLVIVAAGVVAARRARRARPEFHNRSEGRSLQV
jgi:CHAT domain-containing protein